MTSKYCRTVLFVRVASGRDSTSIIYSQQSFMIITGRRMSGCYTCYKIKMDCIDL